MSILCEKAILKCWYLFSVPKTQANELSSITPINSKDIGYHHIILITRTNFLRSCMYVLAYFYGKKTGKWKVQLKFSYHSPKNYGKTVRSIVLIQGHSPIPTPFFPSVYI